MSIWLVLQLVCLGVQATVAISGARKDLNPYTYGGGFAVWGFIPNIIFMVIGNALREAEL